MKMAKIQTPMKSLMLWLRSFDIFSWLLVNTVPITNTATEYRCHQRKVYIIYKLTIKSFKIWIIIPMSFADKEKEYGCWYHGNEQCWNESWRHVSNSFFNISMTINFSGWVLWSSGEGQARIGKGWPLRGKASKLKPEPRAYIKVGHLRVNIGYLKATLVHIRVS